MSSIADCKLLTLPAVQTPAGATVSVDGGRDIPFEIARVYYLYEVPRGEVRGSHAHKALQQLIVAAAGSFDIVLNDGNNRKTVPLNRPDVGLYVPRMIWRELRNFSEASVCLVLASLPYSASDYIRDFDEFLRLRMPANDGG